MYTACRRWQPAVVRLLWLLPQMRSYYTIFYHDVGMIINGDAFQFITVVCQPIKCPRYFLSRYPGRHHWHQINLLSFLPLLGTLPALKLMSKMVLLILLKILQHRLANERFPQSIEFQFDPQLSPWSLDNDNITHRHCSK